MLAGVNYFFFFFFNSVGSCWTILRTAVSVIAVTMAAVPGRPEVPQEVRIKWLESGWTLLKAHVFYRED